MTNILKNIWAKIARFWRTVPEEKYSGNMPSRLMPFSEKNKKRKNKQDHQVAGVFYFREAILDQLDDYFDVLKRMKSTDPGSYQLYRKLGGHIVPHSACVWSEQLRECCGGELSLSLWWKKHRPAFGAISFCHGQERQFIGDDDHKILPALFYFNKYEPSGRPATIQPANGDIYLVTMYWDDGKIKYPEQYALAIVGDSIQVLKFKISKMIKTKKGSLSQRKNIPQKVWTYGDCAEAPEEYRQKDPEKFIANIFRLTMALYENTATSSMVRVDVKKKNLHGVFSIDILRTPYFFKDREVSINENGKRKPVFHIVRTHKRTLANGKETFVKSHFRGERAFRWNGYQIKITVPGRDHFDTAYFDVPGIHPNSDKGKEIEGKEDTIDEKGIAKFLRGYIDA